MTVVVGYVPTPEGRAAIAQAVEESRLRGADLVVVNSHMGGEQLEDGRGAQIEADLALVAEGLRELGVRHEVLTLVRGADPAADLISVARERGAQLIVMGLRRRSTVSKLILGSNALRILHDAPCPVLAGRADRPGDTRPDRGADRPPARPTA